MKIRQKKNCYGTRVFITGASSGIGKACATVFAKHGCQVIGVSRHCKEGKKTYPSGGSIRMMSMDVTNDHSVEQVMNQIGPVDIAILAAGMGVAGSAEMLPMDAVYAQMEVNYFGVLRVASKVLGKMREQKNGLLLVIGSVAGLVSVPMQSHYSSSKFALEAYVEALRMEIKPYGVKAAIIEPGDTKTGFTGSRKKCEPENSPYAKTVEESIAVMEHDEQTGYSPMAVAKTAYSLACRLNPPVRVQVGAKYKLIAMITRLAPDSINESLVERVYLKK